MAEKSYNNTTSGQPRLVHVVYYPQNPDTKRRIHRKMSGQFHSVKGNIVEGLGNLAGVKSWQQSGKEGTYLLYTALFPNNQLLHRTCGRRRYFTLHFE